MVPLFSTSNHLCEDDPHLAIKPNYIDHEAGSLCFSSPGSIRSIRFNFSRTGSYDIACYLVWTLQLISVQRSLTFYAYSQSEDRWGVPRHFLQNKWHIQHCHLTFCQNNIWDIVLDGISQNNAWSLQKSIFFFNQKLNVSFNSSLCQQENKRGASSACC